MRTGFCGTFVISWSQTEIDGLTAAPLRALEVGVVWSWHGEAVRVDGPAELLRLDCAVGEANLRKRAARVVRRLVGAALDDSRRIDDKIGDDRADDDSPLMDSSFVVTDGTQSYTVTLIEVPNANPLLMFLDEMPPQTRDLWVVHHTLEAPDTAAAGPAQGGVICFTPGTMIATPAGPCPVESLREGDRVQTKDNGAEEVIWTGSRHMTGARLFAMPHLRPIRIRAAALGISRPDQELIVSPEHRMVIKGRAARALFNAPEVLVSAREMINGGSIAVDHALREVTYIHLLLPRHEILWANGVETESFHPASTALSTLRDEDRGRLLTLLPDLVEDPGRYGGFARRNLSTSEAAILQHEAA
ncbi:Hint domain-containing protein [Salinihabitans flavidus]|uniref:Hint domain-containing protein n=1 Tax=Salinihabitans flavidus TaxID=569882 RepID=A0A1H8SIN8_9RHOB|nr:Hint domain-containing protein [Salinihabitans flavidus]SEO78427.1 Hint domain-containing protein [Salinihabitans flavidus]